NGVAGGTEAAILVDVGWAGTGEGVSRPVGANALLSVCRRFLLAEQVVLVPGDLATVHPERQDADLVQRPFILAAVPLPRGAAHPVGPARDRHHPEADLRAGYGFGVSLVPRRLDLRPGAGWSGGGPGWHQAGEQHGDKEGRHEHSFATERAISHE